MNPSTLISRDRLELALTQDCWRRANDELCAKILSEFFYEEIIAPEQLEDSDGLCSFRLAIREGLWYEFVARRREFFGFYRVTPGRIVRREVLEQGDAETATAPDVQTLLQDLHALLGFKPNILAPAFREVSNTLVADCHMLANPDHLRASQWPGKTAEDVEGALSAHPWIVANKSRLGFSYSDYQAYAPESKQRLKLQWIAVSRRTALYRSANDLAYEGLIERLLSAEERERFTKRVVAGGRNPEEYYFLPVHPWQLENRIIGVFAREIAEGEIILLGAGDDDYLPQQSIRTLSNVSHPGRPYIKLPISILNTSVYRGLPTQRSQNAPVLSEWLQKIAQDDAFLREESRVILLGEFASLTVPHSFYGRLAGVPYQYNEFLGVIFRESLQTRLDDDESAAPLAALLQRDPYGDSVLGALIADSGLSVSEWIDAFLQAVLPPLLHFLYRYGFVFSPHGQNALLAMRNSIPSRLVVKDFVDDANISVDPLPEHEELPERLYDLLDSLEPQVLIQWIQSGLFVCVFRYLTEILEDDELMREREFWERVVKTIRAYQRRFPEMQERFLHFNLFAPVFPKLCLNSTRLLDIGYEDSAERPVATVTNMVENPLFLAEQNIPEEVSP